jgi:hypothetical protein
MFPKQFVCVINGTPVSSHFKRMFHARGEQPFVDHIEAFFQLA